MIREDYFFYHLPIWGMFLFTLVILFIAFEGGFLLGRHRFKKSKNEKDSLVGPMVAATLGLLAFMLSFTFGVAASHFNDRKQYVLEEANAIRSAYDMTDMLAENSKIESRKLLKEYVDIRLKVKEAKTLVEINTLLARASQIQNQLWSISMNNEIKSTGTASSWLYIQSLTNMLDINTKRISAGSHGRVQESIWIVLYLLAFLSIASMGYHAGLVGIRGMFPYPVLILTFSLVMVLIFDLDRPKQSLFKVSQKTIADVKERMIQYP